MSEIHLYLPQMRLSFEQLEAHAKKAEAAGFEGMAFMDHFAPPMAETQPMYEALVTATWLAARTERLRMGHLVLCDAFRHPAVLAKQVASIDQASGGRFDLGMGWGSVPAEFDTFGIDEQTVGRSYPASGRDPPGAPCPVVGRVGGLRRGVPPSAGCDATADAGGPHPHRHRRDREEDPGAGGASCRLVEPADRKPHRLERAPGPAGDARTSLQQMVCFIPSEKERAEVEALARRRFAAFGDVIMFGTAPELVDQIGALADRGVERLYTWFTDFADPATLAAFGEEIIPHLAST